MAKLGCGFTDMTAVAVVLSAELLATLLYGNENAHVYYSSQMDLALNQNACNCMSPGITTILGMGC